MYSTIHRPRFLRSVFSGISTNRMRLTILGVLLCPAALTLTLNRLQPAKAIVTSGMTTNERALSENNSTPALPQGFVQGRKPTAVAEVELITLTPDGFEPAAITRPQGRFILAYDNISGYSSLNVQLLTESSSPLHRLAMPLLKKTWIGEFDLPPGKYFIKEASQADWSCVVTIN
jgi:hypothetical protein